MDHVDFTAVRLARRRPRDPVEMTADALAFEHESNQDALLTNIYFGRIAGVPVGPLYLGGALGIGTGQAGEFVDRYQRAVQSGNPRLVRGAVAGGSAAAWVEVAGSRDLRAAFGGRLVLEDRLDAAATLSRGAASARLRGARLWAGLATRLHR